MLDHALAYLPGQVQPGEFRVALFQLGDDALGPHQLLVGERVAPVVQGLGAIMDYFKERGFVEAPQIAAGRLEDGLAGDGGDLAAVQAEPDAVASHRAPPGNAP